MLRPSQQIINSVDVEVERAQMPRLHPTRLQLEHDVAAQPEMEAPSAAARRCRG